MRVHEGEVRTEETLVQHRRKMLKLIGTGAVGLAAFESLPARWTKPIVDSVVLPVHAQASGTPIRFESSTLGPTGQTGGYVLANYQFLGVRFQLTAPGRSTAIGIHASGSGSIFGAVVRLSSLTDFPDSYDLTTPDVLGHVTIPLPPTSQEIGAPLSLFLPAGYYALVFGAGPFSVVGSGASPQNGTDISSPSYYFGGGSPVVNTWYNGGIDRVRMFVM